MLPVRVIVVSPEEAADGNAELWLGGEQLAVTVLYDGRLHLRIDSRHDRKPWLIDVTSLSRALDDAARQIAAY
jgi:hypothetical protein